MVIQVICWMFGLVVILAFWIILVFFFQAEDGIRDLVRSRGLGDVYKRQPVKYDQILKIFDPKVVTVKIGNICSHIDLISNKAVSYTHLTLPTSDLV